MDPMFMRQFLEKGARIERFQGDRDSALNIVDVVLYTEPAARIPLQIQKELIAEAKALHITQPGRHVAERVTDMQRAYEEAQLEHLTVAKRFENVHDDQSMALRERALSDADVCAGLADQIQKDLESKGPKNPISAGVTIASIDVI